MFQVFASAPQTNTLIVYKRFIVSVLYLNYDNFWFKIRFADQTQPRIPVVCKHTQKCNDVWFFYFVFAMRTTNTYCGNGFSAQIDIFVWANAIPKQYQ